jgi:Tol biopolymer transport system component
MTARAASCVAILLILPCCSGSQKVIGDPPIRGAPVNYLPEGTRVTNERWTCSDNLRIAVNGYGQEKSVLTSGGNDFKPSWSRTGSRLTFFRALRYGSSFADWKSKLCVIRADGTGFRELTTGNYADFNPTWTRDGSNQIIFNRYAVGGSDRNDVYLISPEGRIGDEVLVSNPQNRYEWAFSGLRDGRIFIDRVTWGSGAPVARSFLLTPSPGRTGAYEEIVRPTTRLWHKLSVSPSETKVAYMLDFDDNMSTYQDVVLCYADFDARSRVVSNPVTFTEDNPNDISEYPRWNADETLIIYDSNRSGTYQMCAYRLADRMTVRLSDGRSRAQFGNFENLPK